MLDNPKKLGKPSAVYRNRMERYPDTVWLIWSNKWNCWYRAKSSGYTDDIADAGLYTREEAAKHMTPLDKPRSHRDTEPFPISAVKALIDLRRAQFEEQAEMMFTKLNALRRHLETQTK